jgi:hypothetical protein
VLRHAIEKFDARQPDRFLPSDAIDSLLHTECRSLLEEGLAQPSVATELMALIDLDRAVAGTIELATPDLLQCGSDRRTLVFVPRQQQSHGAALEKLMASQPLASVITADVGDAVVVIEDAGLAPRSLAAGLERVFPGSADASRRLLTRIDVDWKRLL